MARTDNLTNFLTDVATSIKAKTGDSTAIPASQFDTKIAGITTGKLSNEEYAKANNNLDEILYQSQNVLPDTYQEVEYLESTGTQYIDTNFTPNTNTKAYAEFYVSTIPCGLYSSDSGASLSTNFSSYISGSGKWRFGSGVATVSISNNSFYTSLQDKTGITINGTNFYDYDTTIDDFTSTRTIILLRINTVGFKGKIYKFKLYDGNNISRNFIPCYRKSDNEPGMYDTVNNVFYTNEGTGEFIVGADVDVLNSKIESILTEKTIKILPENIKKDINVLGITGVYNGAGKNFQSNYNLYQKMNSTYSKTSLKLTVNKTGTYTVRWIAYRSSTSYDDFGTAIYINDTLYGTKNTTWNTPYLRENSLEYTSTSFQINEVNNVSLNENDVIEIYGKNHSSYNIFLTALTIEEE